MNSRPDPVKLQELEGIYFPYWGPGPTRGPGEGGKGYDQLEVSASEIYTHIMQEKQHNELKELRAKTAGFVPLLAQYLKSRSTCDVQGPIPSDENINSFYTELTTLQQRYNILNKVEIIEPPEYSSTFIQKLIQLNKYEAEYAVKSARLQEILAFLANKNVTSDVSNLRNEVIARTYDLNTRLSSNTAIKDLSEQISKLQIDDTLDEHVRNSYTQIQNLYYTIEESKKAISIKAQHDELCLEIEQMADLQNYVIGLQRCKVEAPISESICLQYTVENINIILDITLVALFSQPITVKMILAKKLKTKKDKLKMCVDYEVSYNGRSYNSIKQVSVGERKRISLAILIAINVLSRSRLVLIDEAGACLDAKHRSNMIEALRRLKHMGKTVYCIDHETVAGFYDDYHHVKSVS